jgi:hypothetical protein
MKSIVACIVGLVLASSVLGGEQPDGKKIVNKISKEDRRVFGAFGYVPKACPWVEVETRPKNRDELNGQTPVTLVERPGRIVTRHEHLIWAPDEYTKVRNRWSASAPPGKRVYVTIQGFCNWKSPAGGHGGGAGGAPCGPPKWWSSAIDLDLDADTGRNGLENVKAWSDMTAGEKTAEAAEDKLEDKVPESFTETNIQGALVAIGHMTPIRLRRVLPSNRPAGQITISRPDTGRVDVLLKETRDGREVYSSIFAGDRETTSRDIWAKVKDADCVLFLLGKGHGPAALTVRFKSPGPDRRLGTDDDLIATDLVRVCVAMDASIDSDNDGRIERFADGDDERIEDDSDKPGKIVLANNDDDDNDGVPDFADGFLWRGTQHVNRNEDDFVPLEFRVCVGVLLPSEQIMDEDKACVRISYVNNQGASTASDPAGVNRSATPPYVYTPVEGSLRLWKRPGTWARDARPANTVTNDPDDVGGHYVPAGEYTFTQLGLLDSIGSGVCSTILYVEGVRTSAARADHRIIFEVDPDGPEGPAPYIAADVVRVTVSGLEFIETDEKPEDLLPLFNPNPIVTLNATPNPGNAERVRINVSGTVKDYLAPIEQVRINGTAVRVTQTNSGAHGKGPYQGTFRTQFDLTGHTTLIEALAINSLNNLGKDSVLIVVNRDNSFNITGRTVTEHDSLPTEPTDEGEMLDAHRFKLELVEPTSSGQQVEVTVKTGEETKRIVLTRVANGIIFRSEDLFLCPPNLSLSATASDAVTGTRLKGDLGKRTTAEVSVQVAGGRTINYSDFGVPLGMLFCKSTDKKTAHFLESCTHADVTAATRSRSYLVRAGFPGGIGGTATVLVRGTDSRWAPLEQPDPEELFPALAAAIRLTRASNDPGNPLYDFYQADETVPLMAVRTRLPLDNANRPQDNDKLDEVYCVYDGTLQAEYYLGDVRVMVQEPIVGVEIVAEHPIYHNTFTPAEILPTTNAPAPVVSVADGAPRPSVEITECDYVPGAANAHPRRIRVRGRVKDYVADITPGNTLNAVGIRIEVNGSRLAMSAHAPGTPAVPGDGVRIDRAANDPPRPFEATFDAFVTLRNIPDRVDQDAYQNNIDRTQRPFQNSITVSQEAVIVRAVNALGNSSFDSAFVRIVDDNATVPPPAGGGAPPASFGLNPPYSVAAAAGGGIVNNDAVNRPTYAGTRPPRFMVHYHNPFLDDLRLRNQQVSSRLRDGTRLHTKRVTLGRGGWANLYRFGPFMTGSVDRTVTNPPVIAEPMPVFPMLRFRRNAQGAITGWDAAAVLEAAGPGSSSPDTSESLTLDLRLDSAVIAGDDNRDQYLPGRTGTTPILGTDANPEQVRIIARIEPVWMAQGRHVRFFLRNLTRFPGHCNNAPRPPAHPAPPGADFSFSRNRNQDRQDWIACNTSTGRARTTLFAKDFGGRTTVEAHLNLVGYPAVLMQVPLDSDGDFLPDCWEARFRATPGANANNPVRDGLVDDEDRNPAGAAVVHNENGDGFTALEEYRGFQTTEQLAGGGTRTRVFRMDEVPFAFGLARRGNAGAGTLVAGPRVKDAFIFVNSTITLRADHDQYPTLLNVAWHELRDADFRQSMLTPGNIHNSTLNWNGSNDGFDIVQNGVFVRDDNGLLPALGHCGNFFFGNVNVRLAPGAAGHPGTGLNHRPLFGADRRGINAGVLWHELGHRSSLRHNLGTRTNGAAAFQAAVINGALNNTDVDGDGNRDGVVQVDVNSYRSADGTRVIAAGHPLGEVRERVNRTGYLRMTVGGVVVDRPNPQLVDPALVHWMPQNPRWVTVGGARRLRYYIMFPGSPVAAAGFNSDVRGSIQVPETMDWAGYLGPTAGGRQNFELSRNLGAVQMGRDGNVFTTHHGAHTEHSWEIRIRTQQ